MPFGVLSSDHGATIGEGAIIGNGSPMPFGVLSSDHLKLTAQSIKASRRVTNAFRRSVF
jgi:hypothetical protein